MNKNRVDEYWVNYGIKPIYEDKTDKWGKIEDWVIKNEYMSRGTQKTEWKRYASLFTVGSKHIQIEPIIAIKVRYK